MNPFSHSNGFFKKYVFFKTEILTSFYVFYAIPIQKVYFTKLAETQATRYYTWLCSLTESDVLHIDGLYDIQTGNIRLKGDVFTVFNLEKVAWISWKKQGYANEIFLNHSRNPTELILNPSPVNIRI